MEQKSSDAAETKAAKRGAVRSERRRARLAQGFCVDCGRSRLGATPDEIRALKLAEMLRGRAPYPLPHAPTATRCGACAGRHQRGSAARRARDAVSALARLSRPGYPRPAGAPRVNAVMTLRIPLNKTTLDAVNALKRRRREENLAAGRPFVPGQLSRLIRETLQIWRFREGGPFRVGATWFCLRGISLHFRIDAETLAIVDRIAARNFHGSRSAAVRAMILTVAYPPVIAGVSSPPKPRRPE